MTIARISLILFTLIPILSAEDLIYDVFVNEEPAGEFLWFLQDHESGYTVQTEMDLTFRMLVDLTYTLESSMVYGANGSLITGEASAHGAGVDLDYRFQEGDGELTVWRNKKDRGFQLRDYDPFRGTSMEFYNPLFVRQVFIEAEGAWWEDLLDIEMDRVRTLEFSRDWREVPQWGEVLVLESSDVLLYFDPREYTLLYSWARAMGMESETVIRR